MLLRRFGIFTALSVTLSLIALMVAPAVAAIDRFVIAPFVDYIERTASPDYELVGATVGDGGTSARSGLSKTQVRAFRSSLIQRVSSRAAMYNAVLSPASAGPALA